MKPEVETKMATSEMVLVICQLLDETEAKFRRLDRHFRRPAFERNKFKYCPTKPEVENPIWPPQSRLLDEIATKFQRLYLCFRCQTTRLDCSEHCRVSGEQEIKDDGL